MKVIILLDKQQGKINSKAILFVRQYYIFGMSRCVQKDRIRGSFHLVGVFLPISFFTISFHRFWFLSLVIHITSLSFFSIICLFILILVNRNVTQFFTDSSSSSSNSSDSSSMRLYSMFSNRSSRWAEILLSCSTALYWFICFWHMFICFTSIGISALKLKFRCCALRILSKTLSSIVQTYTLKRSSYELIQIFISRMPPSVVLSDITRSEYNSFTLTGCPSSPRLRTSNANCGSQKATLKPPSRMGSRSAIQASSFSYLDIDDRLQRLLDCISSWFKYYLVRTNQPTPAGSCQVSPTLLGIAQYFSLIFLGQQYACPQKHSQSTASGPVLPRTPSALPHPSLLLRLHAALRTKQAPQRARPSLQARDEAQRPPQIVCTQDLLQEAKHEFTRAQAAVKEPQGSAEASENRRTQVEQEVQIFVPEQAAPQSQQEPGQPDPQAEGPLHPQGRHAQSQKTYPLFQEEIAQKQILIDALTASHSSQILLLVKLILSCSIGTGNATKVTQIHQRFLDSMDLTRPEKSLFLLPRTCRMRSRSCTVPPSMNISYLSANSLSGSCMSLMIFSGLLKLLLTKATWL